MEMYIKKSNQPVADCLQTIRKRCGRKDLNLHEVSPTSTSSLHVYQFRHCRNIDTERQYTNSHICVKYDL